MALTISAGNARNERGESDMYKGANHSAGFVQPTCIFRGKSPAKRKASFCQQGARVHHAQYWILDGREKFMGFCIVYMTMYCPDNN